MNIARCHSAGFPLSGFALLAFTACGGGGTASGHTDHRPDPIHTVSGTVSGLVGQGLTIELLNTANLTHRATVVEQIDIVADGAFAFRIPASTTYGVIIAHQPHAPTQRCVVRNGQGLIATAKKADVGIVCGESL